MKHKYLLLSQPRQFSIEEAALDDLAKEWAIIEVLAAPVTAEDYRVYTGKRDAKNIVPGSEAVGKVVFISEEAKDEGNIDLGDTVYVESVVPCRKCYYCLNGEYAVCAADQRYGSFEWRGKEKILGSFSGYMSLKAGTRVHKTSPDIPPELLALSGAMARATRALTKKADGLIGMKVGVLGATLFGLCCCAVASSMGMKSVVVDRGINGADLGLVTLFADSYQEAAGPAGDLDIMVADKAELLPTAVKMLKPQGTAIIPYWLEGIDGLPLASMVSQEQKIIGLKNQAWDFNQAAKVIRDRKSDLGKLLNVGYKLSDIDAAMRQYETNKLQLTWLTTKVKKVVAER